MKNQDPLKHKVFIYLVEDTILCRNLSGNSQGGSSRKDTRSKNQTRAPVKEALETTENTELSFLRWTEPPLPCWTAARLDSQSEGAVNASRGNSYKNMEVPKKSSKDHCHHL